MDPLLGSFTSFTGIKRTTVRRRYTGPFNILFCHYFALQRSYLIFSCKMCIMSVCEVHRGPLGECLLPRASSYLCRG